MPGPSWYAAILRRRIGRPGLSDTRTREPCVRMLQSNRWASVRASVPAAVKRAFADWRKSGPPIVAHGPTSSKAPACHASALTPRLWGSMSRGAVLQGSRTVSGRRRVCATAALALYLPACRVSGGGRLGKCSHGAAALCSLCEAMHGCGPALWPGTAVWIYGVRAQDAGVKPWVLFGAIDCCLLRRAGLVVSTAIWRRPS